MSYSMSKTKKYQIRYPYKRLIAFLLFFPTLSLANPIYKSIDSEGNVTYSDQPLLGSEQIILSVPKAEPLPSSVRRTTPLELELEKEKEIEKRQYKISITEPTNESVFTTDIEKINVNVSIQPELNENDYVVLKINDKIYENTSGDTLFTLGRLDRGSYKLQAFIYSKDNTNTAKGQSEVITIHQIRAIARPAPA